MAVLQMGAVAVPLSILFGPEALAFRLQDSQAVIGHRGWRNGATVQTMSRTVVRHCVNCSRLDGAGLGLDYADALAQATSFESGGHTRR
jgi:acyl-coenzyme A synthetase/AMP-(fatty) acid ligase